MNESNINALLKSLFPAETEIKKRPTARDWQELCEFLNFEFPSEFVDFTNLSGAYRIDGTFLKVANNGELFGVETIASVIIAEGKIKGWPPSLIPFFSVGNGDYYCLDKNNDSVTYLYHEDRSTEKLHNTFRLFLQNELPDFK